MPRESVCLISLPPRVGATLFDQVFGPRYQGLIWGNMIMINANRLYALPLNTEMEFSCAATSDRNKPSNRTSAAGIDWFTSVVKVSVRPVATTQRCILHTIVAVAAIVHGLASISLLLIAGLRHTSASHPHLDTTSTWCVFVLAR